MGKVGTIGEFLIDTMHQMHKGCYNYTKNGECSKCGECCSALLPLKRSEVVKLRRIIKERNIKPHCVPKVVAVNPMFDLTCPFLTDNHECSIYDDRPYICRVFKCDKGKPSASDFANIEEPIIPINVRDLF